MMHDPVAGATSGTSATELTAVAASLGRDVRVLLESASGFSPTLADLAGRASEHLHIALRDAAGSPQDDRWRRAYQALADFMSFYVFCSSVPVEPPSFSRLSRFLAENDDLANSALASRCAGMAPASTSNAPRRVERS